MQHPHRRELRYAVATGSTGAPGACMTREPGSPLPAATLRGRRVVLVDDDPAVLQVLATGLQESGCDVVAFNRFEDAKRYLTGTTPDVLVTDVRLGGFNGLQLAVTGKLKRPDLVAIVMTGYDDVVLKKDAESIGATYVVKPILPSELVHLIASRLP
jgi:DNA-binding NtrC family response regulator